MIETSLTFALRNFMVALYVCSNIGSVLLFSSADHRDECEHWTTLTRRRLLVVHGWPSGARVSRHPTACSHHSNGVDSTTRQFCANCIMKVFFNDCQASNQWRSGDRGDREAVRDGKKSGKCRARRSGLHLFRVALA